MKYFITIILIVGLIACSAKKSNISYEAISQELLLESPFGFTESIDNFFD